MSVKVTSGFSRPGSTSSPPHPRGPPASSPGSGVLDGPSEQPARAATARPEAVAAAPRNRRRFHCRGSVVMAAFRGGARLDHLGGGRDGVGVLEREGERDLVAHLEVI